ncbi:GGDEF domain-containing protein [Gordonibacter sp. 28C]|uniref:GGDEF domain-containing protein n=1 Tax=Gordonibacter sp. 28C TaxID=2078569 RepID=UPI00131446A3|nr:GGDEF domain-containing protein [Gordonibacter sp. 28C]
MDVDVGIALDSLSVVFMLVLVGGMWGSRAKSASSKLYFSLVVAVIVLLCSDIGYMALLGNEEARGALTAVKSLYFVANAAVIWIWAIYVDYTVLGDRTRFNAFGKLCTAILAVNLVLVAINAVTGCMFSITKAGTFEANPAGMWAFTTLNYLSAIVMLVALLMHSAEIRRGVLVRFVLFPMIPFAAESVHLADPSLVLTCSYAVSALMVFQISQSNLVYTDELTGLGNRRRLTDRLSRWFHGVQNAAVCGIMIDLDGLKSINDTHGHAAGDEALILVGDAIRASAPRESVAVRYGGDEFIIAWNADEGPEPEAVAAQLETEKATANERPRPWGPLDFSVGFLRSDAASCPDPEAFVERLDALMYEAKRLKRPVGSGQAQTD